MIAKFERRLERSWHHMRRRAAGTSPRPRRLVVEKAPWLHDAVSPVMLMIDDLTNAWHAVESGGRWQFGGDWGGGHHRPGSALQYLEDRLMRDYPEARVTFFTVAGAISPYTRHQPFAYAEALDRDDDSRRFFRSLTGDPRFELAYHGFNHGTPGAETSGFVQEWQGFPSPQAGVAQTRQGLDIFSRATGATPQGGKYGGWEYNEFGDGIVDDCGFLWWCRDWMPRDVTGRVADGYYDPQFFGRNLVVALPSTVHGHFWHPEQIDVLLANRQIISIEEHIAPLRPDGLVQTPNIIDDMDDLRRLYRYLRGKHVWHATGTDIASYVTARERTVVHDVTSDGFSLRYDGRLQRPALTLIVDCATICSREEPLIEISAPAGAAPRSVSVRFDRERYRHVVTLQAQDGRYRVRPVAASALVASAGGH